LNQCLKGLCIDIKTPSLKEILELINAVGDYCDAIKINSQATIGFSLDDHRRINERVHSFNKFSIIDHKLGDIGYSNKLALRAFEDAGYDAITLNPYSFNIHETVNDTRMKVYVLVLMSNPQAQKLQKLVIEGKRLYEIVAEESVKSGAYGVVVGATVSDEDYNRVRDIIGGMSVLHPGVGAQGGALRKDCLNVVGRSITSAKNVKAMAEWYYERTRY